MKTILLFILTLSSYFIIAQQAKLMPPVGHADAVNSARFSPNGKWIVTASSDYTAKIWEATTGLLVIDLRGHEGDVNAALFSPDGKLIVTASDDNTAKIWDAINGNLKFTLRGHEKGVNTACFSPDGKWIVTASYDETAKVWDSKSGKLEFTLLGHNGDVTSASFSPDSKWIVTSSADASIKVWNSSNGNLRFTSREYFIPKAKYAFHLNHLQVITFSDNRKLVATSASDKTIKLWYASNKKLVADFIGHSSIINDIQFSTDNKYIITASDDKTAKIWNIQTGKLVLTLSGHTNKVNSAVFSPDSKFAATVSDDKTVKIWDKTDGRLLINFRQHAAKVNKVIFLDESKSVLSISDDSTVLYWESHTGTIHAKFKSDIGNITKAIVSPNEKILITVHKDTFLVIWDINSGKVLNKIYEGEGKITQIKFVWGSKKVIVYYNNNTARILDMKTLMLGRAWTQFFYPSKDELFLKVKHRDDIVSASFSHNGKWIVTASKDGIAKVWSASTGDFITDLRGDNTETNAERNISQSEIGDTLMMSLFRSESDISGMPDYRLVLNELYNLGDTSLNSAVFSPDSKRVVIASDDGTAKIWNTLTGQFLAECKGHQAEVQTAEFSPDGKYVLTSSKDGYAAIWNSATGILLGVLAGHQDYVNAASYSPGGNMVATVSDDQTTKIWNLDNKTVTDLKGWALIPIGISCYPSKKLFVTFSQDSIARLWNSNNGHLITSFKGHKAKIKSATFAPDGKTVLTASEDSTAKIWDIEMGNLKIDLKGHENGVENASFSPDGRLVLTLTTDGEKIKIWDIETGLCITKINLNERGGHDLIQSASFSANCKNILASYANLVRVWDVSTGKLLFERNGEGGYNLFSVHANYKSAAISPNGKTIIGDFNENVPSAWDVSSGKLLFKLYGHTDQVKEASFSPDGKLVLTFSYDSTVKIWDALNGKLVRNFTGYTSNIRNAYFSDNGKFVITYYWKEFIRIWNIETGEEVKTVRIDSDQPIINLNLTDSIVTVFDNDEIAFFSLVNGKRLYTLLEINTTDYLVYDKHFRYDGTELARKLLYLTCGTKVIELNQVKDQLWVPNLAERIMKGETINAKTLEEWDICGLAPQTELLEGNLSGYRFRITPRRGGLGSTVLYVNGKEMKLYQSEQLQKNGNSYELLVSAQEYLPWFIPGGENLITIKAYTAANDISSRGVGKMVKDTRSNEPPNLYAVMIGVSDYKGNEMDLQYAAKDAGDISRTIKIAARNWLNADGKEHVFMYNLTTSDDRYLMPEKKGIQKLLQEIGKKAGPNDILLVFFAGHGVMTGEGKKKQFYFLTADASTLLQEAAIKEVGISTDELTEWIKPQNIKAQKRILVFDACNSGQAINDIVKLGKMGFAARNDDQARLVKELDRLNEKSGIMILAASASNQNAYEISKYSQGLLTYCLLKTLKEQPDILSEGKYLDVSRWFNATKENLRILSREIGARQEPQFTTTTNFNIGIVDSRVLSDIQLPQVKPLFTASNFQNSDEAADGDNLAITDMMNLALKQFAENSENAKIAYSPSVSFTKVYSISGRYKISGNDLKITVIIKLNNQTKYKFEENGTTNKLPELAEMIAEKAASWVVQNQ